MMIIMSLIKMRLDFRVSPSEEKYEVNTSLDGTEMEMASVARDRLG